MRGRLVGVRVYLVFVGLLAAVGGCRRPAPLPSPDSLSVLAVETFLADIAQNVAGDRLTVDALLPVGADPHTFEPTPADVARVARADVLIVNGAGFEAFLEELLQSAGGHAVVIEASAGLLGRPSGEAGHSESDPHFWLDPNCVVRYVENIRDGLSRVDPEGAPVYGANAEAYANQLRDLDLWIEEQVARVPAERRLLVTNHESLGYFADRYGFRVVGTILPGASADAAPSARQMAQLIDAIRASGAPAIFLETGANPQLAEQVARETGVRVVTGLYTHSTSEPEGEAPTYIAMIRYNVMAIVEALL